MADSPSEHEQKIRAHREYTRGWRDGAGVRPIHDPTPEYVKGYDDGRRSFRFMIEMSRKQYGLPPSSYVTIANSQKGNPSSIQFAIETYVKDKIGHAGEKPMNVLPPVIKCAHFPLTPLAPVDFTAEALKLSITTSVVELEPVAGTEDGSMEIFVGICDKCEKVYYRVRS